MQSGIWRWVNHALCAHLTFIIRSLVYTVELMIRKIGLICISPCCMHKGRNLTMTLILDIKLFIRVYAWQFWNKTNLINQIPYLIVNSIWNDSAPLLCRYAMCRAFEIIEPCSHLWCGHIQQPLVCKTKQGPPLEGTECGFGKVCKQTLNSLNPV